MIDFEALLDAAQSGSEQDRAELQAILKSASQDTSGVKIANPALLSSSVGVLARLAAFGTTEVQTAAHRAAWEVAQALGIYPASIDALYRQFACNEVAGLTVPAMNMRAIAFQSARGVFRAMRDLSVGAAIFELSRGEIGFTGQRPHEYATAILCAAIAEGHAGPVFLQGDHFQVSATRFAQDSEAETEAVEALIAEAISAGFFNIDIDTSTLVDLSQAEIDAQQHPNYKLSARLANFTRKAEPDGVTISLGGEIGEVGESNSTVAEVNAYLNGFATCTPDNQPGLTKLSIQSGTRHGGNVQADGSFGDMPVDFDLIEDLSAACRDPHGLGGCVQHGASMLTLEKISKLPAAGCIEVHLAAAFLNAVYDNLPDELVQRADVWAKEHFSDEWKSDWSEAQFLHHARRYPIGPFKQDWWQATACHDAVRNAVYRSAVAYFKALRVENTSGLIRTAITQKPVQWTAPVLTESTGRTDESAIQDLAS
ncbi:class II fructose-bisphosphate aldolase [Ruegeria sp. HKCCD8929]|uniref:class II fructose-bisphosphate aldolase n=1 Tax=Ruegeria sp. HKCCD8929 TaxID=2683006 RepID=UPI0014897B29|nr:class II fructose-bisphosphate aldolase [Ruegeria sp. HKCCD8929]